MLISTSIASLHFPICFCSICKTLVNTSTLMAVIISLVNLKKQTYCRIPVQSLDSFQFLNDNPRLVLFIFLLSLPYFQTKNQLLTLSRKCFYASRPPHILLFSPQTFARQLPGLTQSSGPQPGNFTFFSRCLLEAVVIKFKMVLRSGKLQYALNTLCTSCVSRNIKPVFGLGHHDCFINSYTTITLVLSN